MSFTSSTKMLCVFAICMPHEKCVPRDHINYTRVAPVSFGYVPKCSPQTGEYADLWRTNLHIWRTASGECSQILILESDAKPDPSFLKRLNSIPQRQIVWLDSRNLYRSNAPSGCCCIGMLYSKKVLPRLVAEFTLSARNAYAINYHPRRFAKIDECNFDLFLGNLAAHRKYSSASIPILYHDKGRGQASKALKK